MEHKKNAALERLAQARTELLDLGLRNSLLNHRLLRSRGVVVASVTPIDVFELLVKQERALSFAPLDQELIEGEGAQRPASSELLRTGVMPTRHSRERLYRRLLNSFYSSRSALEEHGVNVLYLALGMLEWFDGPDSMNPRRAPLVLVPVRLFRASVTARFRVAYTGEEIGPNLSLQALLDRQFGTALPELLNEDSGEVNLTDYFAAVEEVIAELPRWRVDRSAVELGFFSFSKLLMYRDLDPAHWPDADVAAGASIVERLLSAGFSESDVAREPQAVDECQAHRDLYPVFEADSSQTRVLKAAAAGQHLVIHGPPGTGKSQTICNLIAGAVARGQRVLFVAEKRAALEVVKRRLDQAGLGQACVELHSHKANKKQFLADLKETLEAESIVAPDREADLSRLEWMRATLDLPVRALHRPIAHSGTTLFEALDGFLAASRRLDGANIPTMPAIDWTAWDTEAHRQHRDLVEELQVLIKEIGLPAAHALWGSRCCVFLPSDERNLHTACAEARQALNDLQQEADRLATALDTVLPSNLAAVDALCRLVPVVASNSDWAGLDITSPHWRWQGDVVCDHLASARRLNTLLSRYETTLPPVAWQADLAGARRILSQLRKKPWRFLHPGWWQARRQLRDLRREPSEVTITALIEMADAVMEVQRLREELAEAEGTLRARLGERWQGGATPVDELERDVKDLARLHQAIDAGLLPDSVLQRRACPEWRATVSEARASVLACRDRFDVAMGEAIRLLQMDFSLRDGGALLEDRSLCELERLLAGWEAEAASVRDMVAWNLLFQRMEKAGLGALAELASTWSQADCHLVDLLDYWRFDRLIHRCLQAEPDLASFDGRHHTAQGGRFEACERGLLALNCKVVNSRLSAARPRGSGPGQLGVLRHEFGKQRCHRPIRRLISEAGQAIQAIKPVFMMSPLSVATYLPPGSVDFDLVIFDEASQIRPVDAFGALLRARQAVVVGDSRQLPPTQFWDKLGLADEKEPDQNDLPVGELESILGLFEARGVQTHMLRWHYRSRHESLIAVSNREFYGDRLIVPPSPDRSRSTLGLVHRHLADAIYKPGDAVNLVEAEAVADAVMAHARTQPECTLGVAAFGWPQARAIQDALEKRLLEDPSMEGFFSNDQAEPFFVKNLENVQGDERDVIFISVGYGRTAEGKLSMNFGPLNQAGGERRLNVLITRARCRCEVFTNLRASDIDLTRTQARGVEAFKAFLAHAEAFQKEWNSEPRVPGSPCGEIEADIVRALESEGLGVHVFSGPARSFLSLAVLDPEQPGRMLLGIDLDGPNHAEFPWVRDRESIRLEVLKDHGWTLHRIWSLDWFRDRDRERQRLLEVVEAARQAGNDSEPNGQETVSSANCRTTHSHHEVDQSEDAVHPEKFDVLPYRMTELNSDGKRQTLDELTASELLHWTARVVEVEGPIFRDDVLLRVARAAGCARLTVAVRHLLDAALERAREEGMVMEHGDFLWRPDLKSVVVRDRSALPGRDISRVAPEEIRQAALLTIQRSVGISPDDLIHEVGVILGFARLGERGRKVVRKAIEPLQTNGAVETRNGFWLVARAA